MIFDLLVDMLAGIFGWIGSLLGTFDKPAFWDSVGDKTTWLADQAAGFGGFLPFDQVGTCLTYLVTVIGLVVVIRIVRILLSLFTGGGGSAA